MKLRLLTPTVNRFLSTRTKAVASSKTAKTHVESRFDLSPRFDSRRFLERHRQIVEETAGLTRLTNGSLMDSYTETHQSNTKLELFFAPTDSEGVMMASIFDFLGVAYKPVD